MKILSVFVFFLIPIIFLSCGKNDTFTPSPTTTTTSTSTSTSSGSWKLRADSISCTSYRRDSFYNSLSAFNVTTFNITTTLYSTSHNSITVRFKTLPTTSDTYTIKDYSSSLLGLGATEMTIRAGFITYSNNYLGTPSRYYYSVEKDNSAVKATVTVTSGKIKILIPPIKVAYYTTDYLYLKDTVLLSATLIEN